MKGCVYMKKKAWCDTCIGCNIKKKRYYYCSNYLPLVRNKLNFIDHIIKKWEDKKR